jgi:signal transduction histidine kinase
LVARPPERTHFAFFAPSFGAALHLYALYALNPSSPFYAVAPLMNTFASLMALPQRSFQIAFSALVLPASLLPLLSGAGAQAGFHVVAAVVMLVIANRRFGRTHRVQQAAESEFQRALREAEERLAREKSDREHLEEELQVAQQMESVGWLAGSFAHDFINHLMAIRVYAEILDQSLSRDAELQKDLRAIQEATEGAAGLTARLLALAQNTERDTGPADLRRVVSASLELFQHLMAPHSVVTSRLVEDACKVPVSANRAEQLLVNLALNAREAMPAGGVFSVEVARCPASSVELPAPLGADELVRLTVSDTGCGIAPEVRPHVFEPFFSTKARDGHSGLGLSVAYKIVRESGGHIRVHSEPGHGATFEVYWPAQPVAALAQQVAGVAGGPAPREALRVLLVEDRAELRQGLRRWLEKARYSVIEAGSAEDAIAFASQPDAHIDVLATDVVLPGCDGIALFEKLRGERPGLHAVVFSGHGDSMGRALRELPEDVLILHKPFAPESLPRAISDLLDSPRSAGSVFD